MADSSLHVVGRGTYQFDADVYAQWMTHTKRDLCREIFARGYADEHGATKVEYWALAGYQLAAILAEADTSARDNERDAERLAAARAQYAADRAFDAASSDSPYA